MWLLKLVDSVSTNYRGSDCMMLELCNSLIFPSLISFILILHSILGIKSLVSFFLFFFFLFSSEEMEIYRMDQFLISIWLFFSKIQPLGWITSYLAASGLNFSLGLLGFVLVGLFFLSPACQQLKHSYLMSINNTVLLLVGLIIFHDSSKAPFGFLSSLTKLLLPIAQILFIFINKGLYNFIFLVWWVNQVFLRGSILKKIPWCI